MKVSDYIAQFLVKNKCFHIFGYQGGAVTHLIDSFYKTNNLKFINTYHEQAAAFSAEGYARTNNNIGVCVATSGPGATNLITGIGSAYFDSIPCIYITGQVNTYEYKKNLEIRQLGFQETDIVNIVKPITKYAVRITNKNSIKYELEKAFYLAKNGRKGPVLLDIPMDIQRSDISFDTLEEFTPYDIKTSNIKIDKVISYINSSTRPVFLLGGGIRLSNSTKILNNILNILNIPVVTSLMGKDSIQSDIKNYMGMIGTYGNRSANFTIANSDLIIALGTRLDTRQTGTVIESFAREAKLIRIDIDKNELSKQIKSNEYSICVDILDFLKELQLNINKLNINIDDWIEKTHIYKKTFKNYTSKNLSDSNYIMEKISKSFDKNSIICLDVGQNQMWAAQSIINSGNQRILISGGMGAMGFSLPCSIGAYYASNGNKNIISICGDGGFQMNMQELALLKRNNIPIKIIVMNNKSLGMIRHFQEMYFDSRYYSTIIDYESPNFEKIAFAYDLNYVKLLSERDYNLLPDIFSSDNPTILEVPLSQNTYVYPKLGVNNPIEEQDPKLTSEEFLQNMIIPPFKTKQ